MLSCLEEEIPRTIGSEYTMDIMAWLLSKEAKCLKHKGNSPQTDKRSQLIEWMVGVSGKLGLSTTTLHLAVKILVMFMDGHDIKVIRLVVKHASIVIVLFVESSVVSS